MREGEGAQHLSQIGSASQKPADHQDAHPVAPEVALGPFALVGGDQPGQPAVAAEAGAEEPAAQESAHPY